MKKILIISMFAILLLFVIQKFVLKSKKEKTGLKMEEPKYFFKVNTTGDLSRDIPAFIQLKEGGLLDDPADPASSDTTGVIYTYKGKTSKNWHTNKGITYSVFKKYADKLGYQNTPSVFYEMPNSVWLKIYREIYYKPFENYTNSELLNYYLSLWGWGSGVGTAKKVLSTLEKEKNLNELKKEIGEKELLKFLVLHRIKFFEGIVKRKPTSEKFLQGWKNGALSFYKNFEKYAKS